MRLLIAKAVGTTVLALYASSLFAGSVSNNWLDQWYQAKDGRTSLDQHVQQLEDTTTVYYDNSANATPNGWYQNLYFEKFGQYSPAQDAQIRAERERTGVSEVTPALWNSWLHDLYMEKTGQSPFNR